MLYKHLKLSSLYNFAFLNIIYISFNIIAPNYRKNLFKIISMTSIYYSYTMHLISTFTKTKRTVKPVLFDPISHLIFIGFSSLSTVFFQYVNDSQ